MPAQEGETGAASRRNRFDTVVMLLSGIFGLMLVAALHVAADLLIPVVVAALFHLALSPVVGRLAALGLGRGLATVVVVSVVFAAAAGGIRALSAPAGEWLARLPTSGTVLRYRLRGLVQPLETLQQVSQSVGEATTAEGEKPLPVVVQDSSTTVALFAGTGQIVAGAVVVVVLTLFLLTTEGRLGRDLAGLLPTPALCRRALRIGGAVKRELSTYFLTISLINLGLGVAVGIAMWAAGLPDPLLWGVLAALFNYLPVIGPAALIVLVFFAGLLVLPTPFAALLPPFLVLLLNIVESQFVTPTLLGLRLALSPVVVLLAIVFWGWLWGIAGVFLSVPLLVIARVTCDHVPALAPLGRVIGRRKEVPAGKALRRRSATPKRSA